MHRVLYGMGLNARFDSGRSGACTDKHSADCCGGRGSTGECDLEAKINADATVIKRLAGDFAKASSGSAPGVCQELQGAVSTYEADQQLVLQVAHVSDPSTQTKIVLLTDLVGGTISAIAAVIPSCQKAAAFTNLNVVPPYSVSTFVAEYNRILATATGNAAVDAATAKLKLHRHSKFVRAVTFGRLR